MKLYMYITNPEYMCKYPEAKMTFSLFDHEITSLKEWLFVKTIELDEKDISREDMLKAALFGIDKSETSTRAEFQKDLDDLKDRRDSLLAITHQPDITDEIPSKVFTEDDGVPF